ncbi:MAG: histidinol-phosphate transaminase [Planctomycetota bacterium]
MPTPRDNIQKLSAYTPGEQLDTSVVTKLNTNENPYPPSPSVMDAVRGLDAEKLRVYPPPLARPFREAAAELHGVGPENIMATNGGDELLRLIITCYCEPSGDSGGGGIGVTDPTYSLYPVLAAIQDTPVVSVSRNNDFHLAGDTIAQWNDAGCRVGMIVNPHAPTGMFEPTEKLSAYASQFNGLLLIDEAYVDFAPSSAIDLVREGIGNAILLRSLSKGYSLAGLRFGYGIAHADVIATLDKARDSYNTDALSQAAAVAAVQDQAYAKDTWAKVIGQRERLTNELRQRGFEVLDSQSNYVLTAPPDKLPAQGLYADLKARNLLVRYFDAPRLDDKLRITVGTPEQVDKLLNAIDELS